MAKKKKKNINRSPKRKKMKRSARLQSAKEWVKQFKGKNIVRAYAKWYGQDQVCAIIELRMLGIEIGEEKLNNAKAAQESRAIQRRKSREKRKKREEKARELEALYDDSDETFYYIAGYTPGGAPYGVTWDEVDEQSPYDF